MFLAALAGAWAADLLTGNPEGWQGFFDRLAGTWIGMGLLILLTG